MTQRRRVLVLTQYYRPEPNFITNDVAEDLANSASVTVVTAHPNYPLGRFYPGTKPWLPTRTVERGVVVWRVPMIPDHSASVLRRALSYLSFALAAALLAPFVSPRPDLVWVYNTPFTTPLAAIWFRFVTGARLVYSAADLWPESFVASGVIGDGVLMRIAGWYSRTVNRMAHTIICVTDGIAQRYARDGISPDRLRVIRVWVDGAPPRAEVANASIGGVRRIVYAGNIGLAQSLETLVHAAVLLQARGSDVVFDVYGNGVEAPRLQALASQLGAETVFFHGTVSASDAFRLSTDAFAQVVALRRTPLFAMTVPSKLYFCFAAGTPILYALEGEAAELVASSGGGIAFDSDDPVSLVAAIDVLMARSDAQRHAMSEALASRYNADFTQAVLLAHYADVLMGTASAIRERGDVSTSSIQLMENE